MTFKDLEKILKTLFLDLGQTGNLNHKTSLKNLCLSQLSTQKIPWWKAIMLGNFSTQISSGMAVVVLFGAFLGVFQNQSYAGKIQPNFGLVELTRDGKTKILREQTKLKIGDIIQVSSSANADILLNNNSVSSTALAHTELTIIDTNKIYLLEGTLENSLKNEGEISTKRGKISAQDGKSVVQVSQTGETKIVATESNLTVSDWLDRSTKLTSGETIKLSTDTNLGNSQPVSAQKTLPSSELKKIEAKLLITRTKLLNGIIKINKKDSLGRDEIFAAEKSFRTIYSIINKYFSGKKVDIEQISNEQVVEAMLQKTRNEKLQSETKALFTVLQKAKNEGVSFQTIATNNESYEKFQIIESLFEIYAPNQQVEKNILQSEYIKQAQTELAEIDNKEDRLAYINNIPKNTLFRNELENLIE